MFHFPLFEIWPKIINKLIGFNSSPLGFLAHVGFHRQCRPFQSQSYLTLPLTHVCGVTRSTFARRWGGDGFNSRHKPRHKTLKVIPTDMLDARH